MKPTSFRSPARRRNRSRTFEGCVFGVSLLAVGLPALAKEKVTPESLYEGGEGAGKNWVELSAGGLITQGNTAGAQQRVRANDGPFGGIEDLHYSTEVAKKTTLTIDGRAIAENNDYKLSLDLEREGVGYLKFKYDSFRVWYGDNGGYDPVNHIAFPNNAQALALDRGSFSFEGGYIPDGKPNYKFKYTHTFRDGEDPAAPWGVAPNSVSSLLLYPGIMRVNEKSDDFQFDFINHVRKTQYDLGVRFQRSTLDDANLVYLPQQKVTDQQHVTSDLESVHADTQTWFGKDKYFLSTGFLFANLDDTFTGSRVYGDDFDVAYSPLYPADYYGYNSLYGQTHRQQYVMNLNLMSLPTKNFSITPSLRVEKEATTAESTGVGTWYDYLASTGDTENLVNNESYDYLEVRERLEARYTGVTNWVLSANADLTEGQGSLLESGGFTQTIGAPDGQFPVLLRTGDTRFFQKYNVNARWYPTRTASLDFGGYYKINHYNYDLNYDSTPNNAGSGNPLYPGFLLYQGLRTWDGNTRLTLHVTPQITLITRYEYQLSTIATAPDGASGLGEVDSSRMHTHNVGQNVSWTPRNWLSFQFGGNYVISDTQTPASAYTQSVLNSQNNYWTVNGNVGIVLDDRTDLNLGYYFYRAADGQNVIGANGLPLGADAQEHTANVLLTRRINKNLRLNLKYSWTHYADYASAGVYNYTAQAILASVQYRF